MEFSSIFQDQKSDGQIVNKKTPFYGKSVAIIGKFDNFDEEDLSNIARLLWEHGAIVTAHVTPFTNIVIKGFSIEGNDERQINEIKKKNNLRIICQEDFEPMLDEYQLKDWYCYNNVIEDVNFVAIDFEKINDNQLSVCEVGLVAFMNGKEVSHLHSYINPVTGLERNIWAKSHLSHISDDTLLNAPSYNNIFETISGIIQDKLLVVHSKGADLNYIYYLQKHFSLPKLYSKWVDTKEIARDLGIEEDLPTLYSRLFSTPFLEHHQALDDARACGQVFAHFCSEVDICQFIHEEEYLPSEIKRAYDDSTIRHTQHGTANVTPNGLVLNHDRITDSTFFRGKNVAISGMSDSSKSRIKSHLEDLGAKCTSDLSGKTNIFIIHQNAVGPSKRIKAIELQQTRGLFVVTDDYFWDLIQET